jgi:hypothetical protein
MKEQKVILANYFSVIKIMNIIQYVIKHLPSFIFHFYFLYNIHFMNFVNMYLLYRLLHKNILLYNNFVHIITTRVLRNDIDHTPLFYAGTTSWITKFINYAVFIPKKTPLTVHFKENLVINNLALFHFFLIVCV